MTGGFGASCVSLLSPMHLPRSARRSEWTGAGDTEERWRARLAAVALTSYSAWTAIQLGW